MSITASPPPATEARPSTTALLLCAHGARGVAGAAARHAGSLRRRGLFAAVEAAALYGAPRLEAVLDGMAPGPLTVVPFMMAEGYTLDVLRARLAAARPDAALARPIGVQEALTELIVARAEKGLRAHHRAARETALLLVGHGTTRHPGSAATARFHAQRIAERNRFAEVAVAFLDEAPSVAEAVASLASPFIAAVGFLTDAGQHGATDIAQLLRATGRRGLYLGPIGPDPALLPLLIDATRA